MNITAKIIQHSVNYYTKKEIITYELEYPRYIHAEFMTHRLFSRNSASSRAIPIKAMHEQILAADVNFVHYGKNQPGMQAKEELDANIIEEIKTLWYSARDFCIDAAKRMSYIGAHKQLANRTTEPWMMMKVVMTTTEDANWDWLRRHEDAQPEIRVLAEKMFEAKLVSAPMALFSGEWHVPYVDRYRDPEYGDMYYSTDSGIHLSDEDARIISASCCAQVSYRKNDDGIEKAKMIYDKLINSEPVHASPIEHQATPIDANLFKEVEFSDNLEFYREIGITHLNTDGSLGSGNFRDWIQFRQLIPNNAQW